VAQPKRALKGLSQAKPAAANGFVVLIERNGIDGIVQFAKDLPTGWSCPESPFLSKLVVYQEDGLHKAVWLSFPLLITFLLLST
jgi:hypothetical protein